MKRLLRLPAMILCLSLVLAACAPAADKAPDPGSSFPQSSASPASPSSAPVPPGAVKKGDADTLVYGANAEPGKIDPQNNIILPGLMMERQLYDALVNKNPETGELEPGLALSWAWTDDTHLEMKLREGVKFHDGTPFTAEDVKFTIGRFASGSATSSLYKPFDAENTEVIDDHTVVIAFTAPYAPAVNFLTNPRAYIVCKSWVEQNGEEALAQNANGTGPFMFKEWVVGSSATFERFDGYWGQKPDYKTLLIRFIVEDGARMVALETGEIDVAIQLQDADITRLLDGNVEGLTGYLVSSYKIWYLAFNEDFEPFSHADVRLAIAHAVDWAAAVDAAGGKTASLSKSSVASTIWAYEEQGVYERDLDKAKQHLADAGYPDGFDVTIIHEEIPSIVRLIEIIQQSLAEIGINMTIQVVDTPTWNEITLKGNADMSVGSMTANTADPAHTYSQIAGSSANITLNWQDEEFNRLYSAGMIELDTDKRAEIYKEMQRYVFETAGHIPMFENVITYGAHDYIEGFIPDAGTQPELWRCSIKS